MAGNESGGSQPHVFETKEAHYMVKTRNNPQGGRVLDNELIGALCLDWLGVLHPPAAVIEVPQAVIDVNPGAVFVGGVIVQRG